MSCILFCFIRFWQAQNMGHVEDLFYPKRQQVSGAYGDYQGTWGADSRVCAVRAGPLRNVPSMSSRVFMVAFW